MKLSFRISTILTAAAGLAIGACVHTPPGTSVEVALAKKAEIVRYPAPPAPPEPAANAVAATGVTVPAVEPELPDKKVELVGEAYSRGQFCLEAGKDEEAILAFEEAVKLDPQFGDAWNKLALLYEKTGDEKKALEAFRKSKKVARY
jgi:tetratricopeptide (TPR) repeat protein